MKRTARPDPPKPAGGQWTVRKDGATAVIAVSGDWIARDCGVDGDAGRRILAEGAKTLTFDVTGLGRWDSALVAFLTKLRDGAGQQGTAFDDGGLPAAARKLLTLSNSPPPPPIRHPPAPWLERIGLIAMAVYAEGLEVASLIGSCCLRTVPALYGRSFLRRNDLFDDMRAAGIAALPIVTVVNVLVGGILAFVGAIQLRRFGAETYVASLVGISVVREMAALMTAIIVSGRTGGAYAAHVATMRGNDEIDALRAFGIPLFDYLILPRVIALTSMMPILYLYGCVVGILGGFSVAVLTLHLSPISYLTETRTAVSLSQFGIGLAKSVAFGCLIAIAGCRCGLRAGASANDVGQAATQAVVAGVVGVIALDAIFAICANTLDL